VTVPYYPVFLDLAAAPCVVVGGGAIAEEKVRGLLAAGARVKVVAPELTPGLAELANQGRVVHVARGFRRGDLVGACLALAERLDEVTAHRLWREAREERVPLNVVDEPGWSTFIAPAIVRQGDLTVAISTAGKAPALAVRLKQAIAALLGPEHGRFLDLAGRSRAALLAKTPDFTERRERWYRLVDSDALELLRQGREGEAADRFETILGVRP
jgi:siroheme synthase-like protein